MSLLVVSPVILPPRPEVLASWTHRPHLCVLNGRHDLWEETCAEHGLDADRSAGNAGCPASWNLGFEVARDRGLEYVAIVSQSLELDPPGTTRLGELLERRADERGLVTNWSFHLAVFSVALWERVGPFDEDLPIYCDTDFVRRLYLAGERTPDNLMPTAVVPGRSTRAATLRAGLLPLDAYDVDRRRYIAKWGREPDDPCDPRRYSGGRETDASLSR